MGVDGQRHAPAALHSGMIRYPLYRRLGSPQGRCGRVLRISPPPGFYPRTFQLVASRYTDYAIPDSSGRSIVNLSRVQNINIIVDFTGYMKYQVMTDNLENLWHSKDCLTERSYILWIPNTIFGCRFEW
jgi:hypothetical protein